MRPAQPYAVTHDAVDRNYTFIFPWGSYGMQAYPNQHSVATPFHVVLGLGIGSNPPTLLHPLPNFQLGLGAGPGLAPPQTGLWGWKGVGKLLK